MDERSQFEAQLRDESSGLHQKIVRSIGDYTVALLGISGPMEDERLQLAGTGTLVTFAGQHYILTAAHVWDRILKSAHAIGITLRQNIDHCTPILRELVVPFAPPKPAKWGEWGPDLTFLRIPSEFVGGIEAFKAFYNLTIARPKIPAAGAYVQSVLMGTPQVLGEFTQRHADLAINGLFWHADGQHTVGEFDYLDLNVDISAPGVPTTFGGVSGGGFWEVLVYTSTATAKIETREELKGVAFHESAIESGHRIIRCHGQQSIRAAMVCCQKS